MFRVTSGFWGLSSDHKSKFQIGKRNKNLKFITQKNVTYTKFVFPVTSFEVISGYKSPDNSPESISSRTPFKRSTKHYSNQLRRSAVAIATCGWPSLSSSRCLLCVLRMRPAENESGQLRDSSSHPIMTASKHPHPARTVPFNITVIGTYQLIKRLAMLLAGPIQTAGQDLHRGGRVVNGGSSGKEDKIKTKLSISQ